MASSLRPWVRPWRSHQAESWRTRQAWPDRADGHASWPGDGAPALNPVFDFSYDGVMRSLEESLERLAIGRVDILHIHDPDDHYDEALSGAYRALDELRQQGVIGAVGAGMNQAEMLTRFAK